MARPSLLALVVSATTGLALAAGPTAVAAPPASSAPAIGALPMAGADDTPPAPLPTGTHVSQTRPLPRFLAPRRTGTSARQGTSAGQGTSARVAARALPRTTVDQCSALAFSVRGDTTLLAYAYTGGQTSAVATKKFGWVPKTMAATIDVGTGDTIFWAVKRAGALVRVRAAGSSPQTVTLTQTTAAATGWRYVRLLTAGGLAFSSGQPQRYLYAVDTSGRLTRYVVTDDGRTLRRSALVSERGWWGIKSLSFDRVEEGPAGTYDVLVATTVRGELREYFIPQSRPADWARATLRKTTWNVFSLVTTGFCNSDRPSRSILGVRSSGRAFVYVDQNGNDRSGADIGPANPAGLWRGKVYPF